MIYLDANATTPLLPEVLDAMLPWLRDGFANPSGSYAGAKLARKAIDQARGQVAELIGADAGEIIFTGGGTESANTALHSLDRLTGQGKAVVSAIEHSAVLRCVETLTREVTRVPVTAGGRLDLAEFAQALDGAAYVSLMAANNETGVIQPLQEAAALSRERGLPVHSDAIQVVGKIPLDVRALGVDLLGAFYFTKQAFLHMKPGGSIVNVASIHALETSPLVAPYAAAKAAMLSLTRLSTLEGKVKSIRTNVILPGAIDTPMLWENPNVKSGVEVIDKADVGRPEDVAAVIAYLASDDAAFVQDAEVRVDGGRLDRL